MIPALILCAALSGEPQPQHVLVIGGHSGDYQLKRALSDAATDPWLCVRFRMFHEETNFRPPKFKTSRSTAWMEFPTRKDMPNGIFCTRGMCWPPVYAELAQHIEDVSEERATSYDFRKGMWFETQQRNSERQSLPQGWYPFRAPVPAEAPDGG